MTEYVRGLRGVIAGKTSICYLDSGEHKIFYRIHDLEHLVKTADFERVVSILLNKEAVAYDEEFEYNLRNSVLKISNGTHYNREADVFASIAECVKTSPRWAHPMALLRQAIGNFGTHDQVAEFQDEEWDRVIALDLIGSIGYIFSIVARYVEGKNPLLVKPVDLESMAANLLYLIKGEKPDGLETKVMDVLLMLYAEHEFNVGTWGGVRNAATSQTDIYSCIINGHNNLKGLLHGGANSDTMGFLISLSGKNDLKSYLFDLVEKAVKKETDWKMPGFGHGFYKSGDPRVKILKEYVKSLSYAKNEMKWYDLCEKVERIMLEVHEQHPDLTWYFPNVDFWAAPAYKLLGIDPRFYTPLFAVSRIAGWCAHYLEARHELKEKLIRPIADTSELQEKIKSKINSPA